ncbi:MAG: hypothetical protein CSA33_04055 [Desulfobulbus propionicus]|nr:MAG: hypothetical protein CSA33_04055 [Desulfobulbus propionicus]
MVPKAENTKNVCPSCGGSGEIGYFQGESRFFITREECPACFGLGYILEDEEEPGGDKKTHAEPE